MVNTLNGLLNQPALLLADLVAEAWLIGGVLAAIVIATVVAMSCYKRCPSNKILVIYGRVGVGRSSKCLHGGGAFVMPLVQDHAYLSLEPIVIGMPLEGAPTQDKVRVNVPSTFTVAVSTDPVLMNNAAERLLNMPTQAIGEQAQDIILGQLRLVIAALTIDEIVNDREKFAEIVNQTVGEELNKLGLYLVNVNIREITDESGYLQAAGKRAAAEAIQSYLALHPLKVEVDGRLLTKDGVTLDVGGQFMFAVEYAAAAGGNAAQHLLNLPEAEQKERARAVFLDQVKLLAEALTADEIAKDPDRLSTLTRKLAGGEFKRRGLELISADVKAGGRRFA
ncbi:MAG: flotillin [Phycisphaerales bacterium]